MGNELTMPMEMCSHFDPDEIARLGKRFRKLDLDNSGSLSIDEFMSLPELQQNPLVQRVIEIFDQDGNGEVDFREFIEGVSQFSVKGDKVSKLKWRAHGIVSGNTVKNTFIVHVETIQFLTPGWEPLPYLDIISSVAFRIYDIDNDGFISNGELFQVLKMMVGNNLKDAQLQQIVDKTIIYADKDGDGKISFEEFSTVVSSLDVHKKMVVDV